VTAFLNVSRARRAFKIQLGNANHLIITALVGLDAIEHGKIIEAPAELHAAWSPKDAGISARRSGRLILDMALVRAIDAIDVYIRECIRKPNVIQSSTLRREIDGAGLSIFKKLLALNAHYQNLDPILAALVVLMVTWRNKGAHTEADDRPSEAYQNVIEANAQAIACRFRGLDSEFLLSDFDSDKPPTFKEVTSFINAAHHYVAQLDSFQLNALDPERYLKELIWTTISSAERVGETIDQARDRHLRSLWGRDPVDKKRRVDRFLSQHGLTFDGLHHAGSATFSDSLLEKLVDMSPKEVRAWIAPIQGCSVL
jgi:hypothetical protein